ncbi:hypothetical protein PDM28_16790 [Stenotrophomonas aracearum]|jgi:hypothetical protein|uniref:Uncharacterized protein n=1 Tax=Stenotrophomonas aracearum TaxID=3003272 RepID=A0ABY9YBQ8_9GAMM|nr:hypothetical protein [Stenotrophomonas sp. A5588]WNH48302.1 hypothetical protein PDM28_16790 [Stenotrophomonas sp. A5588]
MSGYWLTEEAFNRLERARDAASLIASVGEGTGDRTGISFDAIAAIGAYVHEDISRAIADAAPRHDSRRHKG